MTICLLSVCVFHFISFLQLSPLSSLSFDSTDCSIISSAGPHSALALVGLSVCVLFTHTDTFTSEVLFYTHSYSCLAPTVCTLSCSDRDEQASSLKCCSCGCNPPPHHHTTNDCIVIFFFFLRINIKLHQMSRHSRMLRFLQHLKNTVVSDHC